MLVPLSIVAGILAVVAVLAVLRPVLFRMGTRNILRRRAQTAVVVAGLMVGTAIIAGSLATGDSLAYAIRKGAYDALGPADLFVSLEGGIDFPRTAYDALRDDPDVDAATFAMSPLFLEEASAGNPERKLSEPSVSVIGFDPDLDRAFGDFVLADGTRTDGSDLAADEAFVLESVAQKLEIAAGDTLVLRYAVRPPPLIPTITVLNGSIQAGASACPPVAPPAPVPLPVPVPECPVAEDPRAPAVFPVEVAPGAKRVTAVLLWPPQPPGTDLDLALVAPDGLEHANRNGTTGAPDVPVIVNATLAEGETELPPGNWTLRVTAKAAANQPFQATTLVFHEVYDLAEIANRTKDLQDQGFDPEALEETFGSFDGLTPPVSRANFTVKGVVRAEGKGDLLLGSNVFIRLDRAQEMYERPGRVNLVAVSIGGDTEESVARSSDVAVTLDDALAEVRRAHPRDGAVAALEAREVKAEWLEAADEAGQLFKTFLTTIGSFTIVAGVMLIVNIFVMLAEERKSELGMARAVGLTRRQLVLVFAFEGVVYALAAAVVGVFLGMGISFGLIWGFNNILAAAREDNFLTEFPFHPEPASLAWAFAAGFLLTIVTVALASAKVSRLNVVRAIRRIEEPKRRATRAVLVGGAALLLLGLAGSAAGAANGSLPLLVLMPCLAAIGAAMVASRFVPARVAFPVGGALAALYSVWTIFGLKATDDLLDQLMGPARGVIIVVSVVLIVVNIPQIVPFTKRVLLRVRGLVPAVKPGVAYPLEKKTRTGLTMAMFALVILVVVAFSTFTATFNVDLAAQAGGYDVEGESTVAIEDLRAHYADELAPAGVPDPFARVARYDSLVWAMAFGGDLVRIEGEEVNYQGPPVDDFYAFGPAFAAENRFELDERLPRFATDREAYEAVVADPQYVIVSALYNFDEAGQPGAFQVGDTVTLLGTGGETNLTIAGIQKQFHLGGFWVNRDVLDAQFGDARGFYLFKLNEGEDAALAAREIEAAFEEIGMDASSIEEEAARDLETNRRFYTLFELFLAFGLVVGIASLGIVTARSVIERRQEIGMLRAIGYSRRDVHRIFLIEILFTTTLGVAIGTAIGLLVSYGVVASTDALDDLGVKFTIPWVDIATILAITYAAVLACTFLPARAASRVPPAEAVRYIE